MKSTGASAIILALIVLLLVLGAAFIFLFQGRQTLLDQRESLNSSVSDLQSELDANSLAFQAAEATRSAVEADLATAVADAVLLEGQLVESQQQVDTLTAENDELSNNLETATESLSTVTSELTEITGQPPQIEIIAPETDTAVFSGEEVEIMFAVMDPVGVTVVNLLADGETIETFEAGDEVLFTAVGTWEATGAGEVEIGVLAVNKNGLASETTTINLIVAPQVFEDAAALDQFDPNASLRDEIENNVAEIRGLEPLETVTTTLLTKEELRLRVENDLLEDYTEEDAHNDYLMLTAFDFLPPDFDLYTFTRDLYSEQIAGFYDPDTDEFVVISADDELDADEQLTHAHEYMHALQDQYYVLDLDNDERDDDAATAYLALIEGEAVLLQSLYLVSGFVDINEFFAALENAPETPVLDNAPPVLANSLLFPYTTGLEFVQTLFEQDGFAALDDAWQNLPQSTEQILHPERYLAGDTPQLVTLPPLTGTLGAGWYLVDENVLGEFMVREYLSQQLTPEQVNTAVTGWGGDRYAVYTNRDENIAMVLRLVWDSDDDATEFAALYPNYPSALFDTDSQLQGDGGECWQGEVEVICLFQDGRETTIIRAPVLEMALAIATQISS